jgi:CBS domain-containing membrane protein
VKVRDIMTAAVETIGPAATLLEADELMTRNCIRHLPVTDGDVLVGLVSHRDVLAASVPSLSRVDETDDLAFKSKTRVERIMRGHVETIGPDGDALDAAETLMRFKIGCLPVVDERRRVIGIVTETDFVRLAAALLRRPARRAA